MPLAGAIAGNAKKQTQVGLAMFGAARKLCRLMDFVAKESERGLPMKFRSPETEEVFGNTHDEIIGGVE